MQKVFDRFDTDQSGYLDIQEVKEALKILLGADVSADVFENAMNKFDQDGSGELSLDEFEGLVNDLRESRNAYVEEEVKPEKGSCLGHDRKLPLQDIVHRVYNDRIVVTFVASCIVGNFAINIAEKQIDPDTKNLQYQSFWATADFLFNVIFLVELITNMWSYGGPVRKFWASGWNVFDTIIVTVGVLTMVNVLGPPLDKLKLMRAFRVFRLFKRIESLNKIIVALMNSIPGVINAFVVMVVFFCIYAILAVELFRDFGEGGTYWTYDSTSGKNVTVDSVSDRGYIHGIEYYGTFMRALYTLFQTMTGESWSEAIARPLIFGWNQDSAVVVGIFFVSFIILTQLVLINVVVAVLLEKFVADPPDEEASIEARLADLDKKEKEDNISTKLDKIMCDMATLTHTVAEMKIDMLAMRDKVDRHGIFDGVKGCGVIADGSIGSIAVGSAPANGKAAAFNNHCDENFSQKQQFDL